jgi:hypothetical protein
MTMFSSDRGVAEEATVAAAGLWRPRRRRRPRVEGMYRSCVEEIMAVASAMATKATMTNRSWGRGTGSAMRPFDCRENYRSGKVEVLSHMFLPGVREHAQDTSTGVVWRGK